MLRGALLDTWWQLTPVLAMRSVSCPSHFFEDAAAGSNSQFSLVRPSRVVVTLTNMLSSVTSPNSDDHRSIFRTPGNLSMVNCGKSSSVISPYFFFIASAEAAAVAVPTRLRRRRATLEERANRVRVGGDPRHFLRVGERTRVGSGWSGGQQARRGSHGGALQKRAAICVGRGDGRGRHRHVHGPLNSWSRAPAALRRVHRAMDGQPAA